MRRAVLSFVLVSGLMAAVTGVASGTGADPSHSSGQLVYSTSQLALQNLGSVNLTAIANPPASPITTASVTSSGPPRTDSMGRPALSSTAVGSPISPGSLSPIQNNHGSGFTGFNGITAAQQAAVNGGVGPGDLEPPDQGTCVGPDAHGHTLVVDFINNALAAYTPSGTQVLPVTPSYALFNQPAGTFMSDPRCYFDATTQRWFFTQFTVGNTDPSLGPVDPTSTQFIAVSKTSDPLGNYRVFGLDTTDISNPVGNCPCFGDFDQIGADANGFYITTNEFSNTTPANSVFFNGTVMYAISKQRLEWAANGAPLPTIARYAITGDAFGSGANNGPYHVSPSSTPPDGNFAPNTEFFVESNSTATSDNHLMVYALTDTNKLWWGGVPSLAATEISSEAYAFPPNATQQPGPLPLGSIGVVGGTLSTIQNDFNAVQQVTYTNGNLYAELDTAAGSPSSPTSAAAWFKISAAVGEHNVWAQIDRQGYVASSQNLMYPDIVVNGRGNGFLIFSVSGPTTYPSAAYVAFDGHSGPEGPINIAAAGAGPEDGFTCYAFFVGPTYGGCRWGDYSGGAVWNGQAYMMAEYIPNVPRTDIYNNWGTFVWSASTH